MANKYLDQAGLGHLWEKIKSRYITGLTAKGRKITFTRGDGTTGEIETQDTTYSDATQSSHGLMTADDKTKLDGIAAGANKTTVDNALSSSSTNPVQNKVINTALGNKVDKVSGKGLSTNDYTTDEKNKLSGIASGAEVNVQSDWSVTSTTSDAFIKNKPTIPSKTSQLTNDSNYVSDANYVHTDSNYTAAEKTKLSGIAEGANKTTVDTALSSTSTNPVQNKAINTALGNKVDKVSGKGLSTNDYTTDEKNKLSGIEAGAQKNTVTGVKGNAESSYRTGNINLTAENVGALPKTTYEYNKEVSFRSTGKLLIGKFPCYDSNVTIEINATTSKTYHAVAILATQNINETGGGQKTFDVYGDDPNQVAPNLYLLHPTNSRYIEIYFSPEAWSKNFIHIQALNMQGTPTNICESVSSIPSTANVKPTNQSRYLNTLVYRPTTANDNYHDSKMRYYLATNTMTTGKPPVDAQIIHLPWDNTGWDRQIALGGEGDTDPRIFVRSSNSSGTYGDWVELYSTYKKPTASDVGAAAASHKHDAGDITSGTLAVARGGTGKTTAQDAANSFINALSEGSSAAQAGDYIVAQYAGGGTSTTTYHRRKLSDIFKALTKSDVTTALGYTPPTSDTNTTYTLTQDSSDGHKLTFKPSSGSATTITIPDNNTVTRVKGNSESSYRTGDVNLTAANIGAAAASHTHPVNQIVTGDCSTAGTVDPLTAALVGKHASNKSFGLPASAIKIEYSTNGGSTWTDYGASDAAKQDLFNERGNYFTLGKVTANDGSTTNLRLRITIEPTDRYVSFHGCYIWMSTNGDTVVYDLERSTIGAKDTFSTVFKNQPLQGWSGANIRYFSYGTFGGGRSQTSNNYKYRLTFKATAVTTTYGPAVIQDIRFIGTNVWNYPSGGAGNMLLRNHMYYWDQNFNVWFPNQIQAENKLTIHGGTAESNAYGSANPTMEFKNSDSSQNLSLVYTDYDSVQNPSSLTLIGNQGGEYLIAPNFKATGKFYGTATKADSATTATTADKAGNLLSTDNRNDNQPPSWYMSKYTNVGGIVNEFKVPSKIGVNSIITGSFCSLITIVPWKDNSGSRPIQIAMADTGVRAQRVATSDSAWGSWIQLPNADTNTTYSAGSNITLSGTTFSLTKANVVGALGYTPPATTSVIDIGNSNVYFAKEIRACKHGNMVFVWTEDCESKKTSTSGSFHVATLPSGYRPSTSHEDICWYGGAHTVGVYPDGTITIQSTGKPYDTRIGFSMHFAV